MTYVCHAKGCKYTTEKVMRTFTHEKRKGGDHKMGLDFGKFFKDPKVIANIDRLSKECVIDWCHNPRGKTMYCDECGRCEE